MDRNPLRMRIQRRLDELQLGPIEAAVAAGLERNYIRDLLDNKKQSFNQKHVGAIAEVLKWSPSELMGEPASIRSATKGLPKIVNVPLLDSVTAGKLRGPSSQIPVEDVPLLAYADLGRGEFFALKVEGDSMDRLSPDGSVIVINQAERTLVSNKPYVISVRGEATFKIWRPEPPRFAPYSTNPVHEPIFVKSKAEAERLVVGRVKRTVLDL